MFSRFIFSEPASNLVKVIKRQEYITLLIVILSFISAIIYKEVYIAMFHKFVPDYQYKPVYLLKCALISMPCVFLAFIAFIYAEKRGMISEEPRSLKLFMKYFPLIFLIPAFINAYLFNLLLVFRTFTTCLVFWLITSFLLDFKKVILKQGRS